MGEGWFSDSAIEEWASALALTRPATAPTHLPLTKKIYAKIFAESVITAQIVTFGIVGLVYFVFDFLSKNPTSEVSKSMAVKVMCTRSLLRCCDTFKFRTKLLLNAGSKKQLKPATSGVSHSCKVSGA